MLIQKNILNELKSMTIKEIYKVATADEYIFLYVNLNARNVVEHTNKTHGQKGSLMILEDADRPTGSIDYIDEKWVQELIQENSHCHYCDVSLKYGIVNFKKEIKIIFLHVLMTVVSN